jgi:hypothetical protein
VTRELISAQSRRGLYSAGAGQGAQSSPLPRTPIPAQTRSISISKEALRHGLIARSLRAHLVLESTVHFGLMLYWNEILFSGSFLDWKMLEIPSSAKMTLACVKERKEKSIPIEITCLILDLVT